MCPGRADQRAQGGGVRFHDLRHTFGTRMAAAGVPMRTLQEWLGHRDFATTLRDYWGERYVAGTGGSNASPIVSSPPPQQCAHARVVPRGLLSSFPEGFEAGWRPSVGGDDAEAGWCQDCRLYVWRELGAVNWKVLLPARPDDD